MAKRLRKIKKNIRLHSEGTQTLIVVGLALTIVCVGLGYVFGWDSVPFWVVLCPAVAAYAVIVNFFRCPIRLYKGDTEGIVLAPADGKVVVVEEVEENEYFHDRRLMISIFMSVFNVHANWIPADGTVKVVRHHNGRFQAAWLPKASTDNE